MAEINTEINLYAFWKYDLYPYVLGAPASIMKRQGEVYVDSYQAWFYPILLLPIESGELLQKKLVQLEKEYDKAHQDLEKKFCDMIPEQVRK